MKKSSIILSLILCTTLSGCGVLKQLEGVYNMTECKYSYNSISQMSLSGIDVTRGVSITSIPTVLSILTGQATSIPLNFNLNLDVDNPNASEALMHGLEYILSIDNIQFTTGSLNRSLSIPAGGREVLPLNIGLDLKTLLSGQSGDAALSIVKNLIGIGDQKSNITVQLKPSFMIGNYPVSSPAYIPVNFSFGGK